MNNEIRELKIEELEAASGGVTGNKVINVVAGAAFGAIGYISVSAVLREAVEAVKGQRD